MEAAGFGGEGISGVAAGIDDGFLVVEDPKGKEALAQKQPDTLGGIEFGAVGRQRREADVVRDGELLGAVPAGLIEGHDGMDVRGQGAGEVFEEDGHGDGRDLRQDECEVLASGRAHGGEDNQHDLARKISLWVRGSPWSDLTAY